MTGGFLEEDDDESLCSRCKVATTFDGAGADEAHYRFLLARAAAAVRAMPDRPRELEEFFYEVHGEAL